MAKEPQEKFDPYVAIRDPDSLPPLVISGIYSHIMREASGNDPTEDDFVKAFNVVTWGLLTAGPRRDGSEARIKTNAQDESRVQLTNAGKQREREMFVRERQPLRHRKRRGGKRPPPIVKFSVKVRKVRGWAKGLYEDAPERFSRNWWEVNRG